MNFTYEVTECTLCHSTKSHYQIWNGFILSRIAWPELLTVPVNLWNVTDVLYFYRHGAGCSVTYEQVAGTRKQNGSTASKAAKAEKGGIPFSSLL